MHAAIEKVQVTGMFWKDLADWRNHPMYWSLREKIADVVLKSAAGEPAGDVPFTGRKKIWENIRHAKVGAKLTLFTMRDESDVLVLSALKKHDFYGFHNERSNMAVNAALKIRNARSKGHVPRPDWNDLKWAAPVDLIDHPEIKELSEQGLEGLYNSLHEEADSLSKLIEATNDLSPLMVEAMTNSWIEDLDTAMGCVEDQMLRLARRPKPALSPNEFEGWTLSPA